MENVAPAHRLLIQTLLCCAASITALRCSGLAMMPASAGEIADCSAACPAEMAIATETRLMSRPQYLIGRDPPRVAGFYAMFTAIAASGSRASREQAHLATHGCRRT